MGFKLYSVLFWFIIMCPTESIDRKAYFDGDRWKLSKYPKMDEFVGSPCMNTKPTLRNIVKRVYAILPYFDKNHANSEFLHKFRGTIYGMSEADEALDREAGFYAAILVPVTFLYQQRDTWCLLERFHRAIRLYQISHPTDKRSALKLLQNLRSIRLKIRRFIFDMPGVKFVTRTTVDLDIENEEEIGDKKDIAYLKELIKSLGRHYIQRFI